MENDRDLSVIDFLEDRDYREIIDVRWLLFSNKFGKQGRFNKCFEHLRNLRNKIKHNNPTPLSDLK
jgi:hypothetical protein